LHSGSRGRLAAERAAQLRPGGRRGSIRRPRRRGLAGFGRGPRPGPEL